MRRPQDALEDAQRAAIEARGLPPLAPSGMKGGEVCRRDCRVRVAAAEQPLLDGEGPAVKARRLGMVVSARVEEGAEVLAGHGDFVISRSVDALEDSQRTPIEPFGLIVPAAAGEDCRQRRAIGCRQWMARAERALADGDGAAGEGFTSGKPSAGVLEAAEVVIERCQVRVIGAELAFENA